MSDDIDIEEHDILDNPHIKNIFPDLSVVKKEIEYFNEALPVKQESELSEPKSPKLDLGNKVATNFNTILNTNDDENVQKGSNSPTDSVKKLDTNISFQNKNKIIIGSKPNKTVLNASGTRNKNQIRFPKVFLHDVRTNLEKSERYCKECKVLFAEKSKLKQHEKKNHSMPKIQVLTKTRVNPRLKKSNENEEKSVTTLDLLKSLADEIDEPLRKMDTSNETLASCKTKTNISLDTSSSEEDEDVDIPVAESNTSDSSEDETVVESLTKLDVPRCRICHICVANRGNLIRHYRAIHRKKLTFVSTKTTVKSEENSSLKRSSRKSNYVPVNVNKTMEARDSSIRCETCNTNFSSNYSLNRHNRNVHQSKTETSPLNLKIDVTKTAQTTVSEAKNKKCFHCDKDFPDSKSLIEHVYQILKPKRTRNSNRIVEKLDQAKRKVAIKNNLQADNETSNKKNLRSTKIKTNNNATKIYNKTLNRRNEKVNKNELHLTKMKTNKKLIKRKKRFVARSENTKKHNLRPIRINSNTNGMKSNEKENNTKDQMYVCPHCTYCFLSIKNYTKHIINRHGTKVTKIKRQLFDPQCKYCSSNNVSALAHNRHLHKEHLDVLEKNNGISKNGKDPESNDSVINTMQNSKEFAFKSAIFKCGRCDVHFISSETAKDHIGHIEILINWKCSICNIIFKKKDENMHLLQHLSSEHIVVHEFSSEALSSLLYNCTKCAIHFSENFYIEHYEKCEKETAISTYCKPCDILINEVDAQTHSSHHNQNKTFSANVITSDIIFDNKSSSVDKPVSKSITKIRSTSRKDNKLAVNDNTLTYCPACQCYMVLVRKVHFKRQCTHIVKHVCVDCGLQLTNKCIDTHRKGHKLKKLTMQDFIFTDMSGNIIKPPIPEYPQCEICKVYFLSKPEIISHVCSGFSDFSSCEICKIKLSNSVFKLHMAYHNYSFKNENLKSNNQTPQLGKKKNVISEEVNAAKNTVISTNSSVTGTSGPKQKHSTQDLNEYRNSPITKIDSNVAILFSCNSCYITLNTYDKLIEHCQNHPTAEEAQSLNLRGCSVCNLKFDFHSYEIHNEIHANNLILKNLAVDFKHFAFDNKIWLFHVFQNLNSNQIIDIVGKSIYQNEHRVRFKILQNGPPNLTIYKCDKCSLFFDHEHVFRHGKCKNLNVKGTPCASCGLKFLSAAFRNQHIKTHYGHPKITEKSYRILLFNQASDEMHPNIAALPSQYIIYQCRNCNGVIEKFVNHQCSIKDLKKCYDCGLFIYKENYKNHGHQHKNLINFEPDNIKVILLGAKDEKTDGEIVVPHPNFKGLIYDYTLYQCKRCEICVKNDLYVSNHVCVFGIFRCQCLKCEFFFNSKGYNHHIKTHNVDPDFTKENINIIQFDLKSNSDVKGNLTNVKDENKDELDHKVKIEPANTVVLYKCKCGLHFVNRSKVIKHIKQCHPKTKSYKQNCTKCSLLFNPSELFSHLVNHHGNKSQLIKYEVKEITEENMEEFIKVILFNCSKCGLHYLDKTVATDHYKLCKGEMGDFEECTKCKIIYDKPSFVVDEHNEKCENMFEIEIIEESNIEVTDDVDLSQKSEGLKTSAENVTTEP